MAFTLIPHLKSQKVSMSKNLCLNTCYVHVLLADAWYQGVFLGDANTFQFVWKGVRGGDDVTMDIGDAALDGFEIRKACPDGKSHKFLYD